MKESYLHWMWENKVFSSRFFKTIQGQEVEILDFGTFNHSYQGPDFQNASLRLEECILHGQIEVHVSSSDWLAHGHEGDIRYSNIILHVVWEHDLDVNHPLSQIPTIELSEYAIANQPSLPQDKYGLACVGLNQLSSYPWPVNYKWNLIVQNYFKKAQHYLWHKRPDTIQVLYEMLGAAMGSKVNQHAFVRLCKEVPFVLVNGLPANQTQFLYMTKSGLSEGNKSSYFEYKGLLPSGHPKKRLEQFAKLIQQLDFVKLMSRDWAYRLNCLDGLSELSTAIKDRLLFDALVPFYVMRMAGQKQVDKHQNSLCQQLFMRKLSGQNSFTKALKKQGVEMNTYLDEFFWKAKYQRDCAKLKCLTCPIHQITKEVNESEKDYSSFYTNFTPCE